MRFGASCMVRVPIALAGKACGNGDEGDDDTDDGLATKDARGNDKSCLICLLLGLLSFCFRHALPAGTLDTVVDLLRESAEEGREAHLEGKIHAKPYEHGRKACPVERDTGNKPHPEGRQARDS